MDAKQLETALFEKIERDGLVLTPINVSQALDVDADTADRLLADLTAAGKLERVSGEGRTALYRAPGASAVPVTENAVAPAKSSQSVYHLLLNAFFPGFGSLLYGRWALFGAVLLFLVAGGAAIAMTPGLFKLTAIAPFFIAWLVSFLGGIYYYAKDPWGTAGR